MRMTFESKKALIKIQIIIQTLLLILCHKIHINKKVKLHCVVTIQYPIFSFLPQIPPYLVILSPAEFLYVLGYSLVSLYIFVSFSSLMFVRVVEMEIVLQHPAGVRYNKGRSITSNTFPQSYDICITVT